MISPSVICLNGVCQRRNIVEKHRSRIRRGMYKRASSRRNDRRVWGASAKELRNVEWVELRMVEKVE